MYVCTLRLTGNAVEIPLEHLGLTTKNVVFGSKVHEVNMMSK
jgi:hypothetical protein